MQFPIDMSLPWLLIDHLLESYEHDVTAVDHLLYPLAIYGDVAFQTLHTFQARYASALLERALNF